jgi:NAD(P)-dependent dehydrogenase (short-subunit alcohol dehydrogenase family)
VAASAKHLGGIDILVPNVSALSVANDESSWEAGFNTDLMGTVVAVDAALPFLKQSTAASIVIISSVSGREIDFAAGPYGALQSRLDPLCPGACQPARRAADPGQHRIAGKHLLPRRHLAPHRA